MSRIASSVPYQYPLEEDDPNLKKMRNTMTRYKQEVATLRNTLRTAQPGQDPDQLSQST